MKEEGKGKKKEGDCWLAWGQPDGGHDQGRPAAIGGSPCPRQKEGATLVKSGDFGG